jgi:hypothetical protein
MAENQVQNAAAEANQVEQQKAEWREKALNILHATAKINDLVREEEENEAPSNQLRNMAELLHMDVMELLKDFEEHGEDRKKWYFFRVINDDELIGAFGEVFDGFGELIDSLRHWDEEDNEEN